MAAGADDKAKDWTTSGNTKEANIGAGYTGVIRAKILWLLCMKNLVIALNAFVALCRDASKDAPEREVWYKKIKAQSRPERYGSSGLGGGFWEPDPPKWEGESDRRGSGKRSRSKERHAEQHDDAGIEREKLKRVSDILSKRDKFVIREKDKEDPEHILKARMFIGGFIELCRNYDITKLSSVTHLLNIAATFPQGTYF